MLDHITLQVGDLPACSRFYDAVLAPLGGSRLDDLGRAVGYGVDRPTFWLGTTTSRDGIREHHIAFEAPSRDAVVAFWEAALDTGAEGLHPPRVWPEYHESYFGAVVRDPEGHNVEAVCHAGD